MLAQQLRQSQFGWSVGAIAFPHERLASEALRESAVENLRRPARRARLLLRHYLGPPVQTLRRWRQQSDDAIAAVVGNDFLEWGVFQHVQLVQESKRAVKVVFVFGLLNRTFAGGVE